MRHLTTTHVLHWRTVRGLAKAIAIGSIFIVGCTAEVETAHPVVVADTEAVVQVDTVPVDVYSYPRAEYRGRPVYLVNGRWYYPQGRRWYYYRTEPTELIRHRRSIQQAPPARPHYGPTSDDAVRVR